MLMPDMDVSAVANKPAIVRPDVLPPITATGAADMPTSFPSLNVAIPESVRPELPSVLCENAAVAVIPRCQPPVDDAIPAVMPFVDTLDRTSPPTAIPSMRPAYGLTTPIASPRIRPVAQSPFAQRLTFTPSTEWMSLSMAPRRSPWMGVAPPKLTPYPFAANSQEPSYRAVALSGDVIQDLGTCESRFVAKAEQQSAVIIRPGWNDTRILAVQGLAGAGWARVRNCEATVHPMWAQTLTRRVPLPRLHNRLYQRGLPVRPSASGVRLWELVFYLETLYRLLLPSRHFSSRQWSRSAALASPMLH